MYSKLLYVKWQIINYEIKICMWVTLNWMENVNRILIDKRRQH